MATLPPSQTAKGQVTAFTYDGLNRIVSTCFNQTVNAGMTSCGSTITYQYDLVNRQVIINLRSDEEMGIEGVAIANSPPGEAIKMRAVSLAKWTNPVNGTVASFDHRRNKISVKSPNHTTLSKMFRVAIALGARVQGDGGEDYDALAWH